MTYQHISFYWTHFDCLIIIFQTNIVRLSLRKPPLNYRTQYHTDFPRIKRFDHIFTKFKHCSFTFIGEIKFKLNNTCSTRKCDDNNTIIIIIQTITNIHIRVVIDWNIYRIHFESFQNRSFKFFSWTRSHKVVVLFVN